ncbi:MAG: PspC domain-containing protein [Bacteroidota bacterium]
MALQDIDQNLQRLRDLLSGDDHKRYASAIHERRVQELNKTIRYADKKLQSQKKTRKRNQMLLIPIGLFLVIAAILSLPGLVSSPALYVFSALAGFFGLGLILDSLGKNPLQDMRKEIDKLHHKLQSLNTKQTSSKRLEKEVVYLRVHKAKKNRVIAGVASELAARLDIPVSLSRFLWVMFLLFSGGAAIFVYFMVLFVMRIFPGIFDDSPAPKRLKEPTDTSRNKWS